MLSKSTKSKLVDLTNFYPRGDVGPSERKRVGSKLEHEREKKRAKLQHLVEEVAETSDSDTESGDNRPEKQKLSRHASIFRMRNSCMAGAPSARRAYAAPTQSILRSFVSSRKSDVYKCDSIDEATFTTVPYACSYSNAAKKGNRPHLAVATEQGTVHILDTSKRRDWDYEPQRTTLQPHVNGAFDVKWSPSDNLLATASGDQSVRITTLAPVHARDRTLHVLCGHQGTVKCVTWDPSRDGDMLCSGGRDGTVCLWDLRVDDRAEDGSLKPVLSIHKAHEPETKPPKPAGRRKIKPADPLRSITHLTYSTTHPFGLVSSDSFDGVLKLWDIRLPSVSKKSKAMAPRIRPIYTSSADPTTYLGSRRARGITTLAEGTGPTAGMLFGLGTDSRIHTYSAQSLQPLSGLRGYEGADPWAYTHERMQTHSFYVRMALSPCGRWLATGNTTEGRAFLFDIGNAASMRRAASGHLENVGVELRGHVGEVGALDWAGDMLATCADDGTVRVWRPDVETSRRCVDNPEELQWDYNWASQC